MPGPGLAPMGVRCPSPTPSLWAQGAHTYDSTAVTQRCRLHGGAPGLRHAEDNLGRPWGMPRLPWAHCPAWSAWPLWAFSSAAGVPAVRGSPAQGPPIWGWALGFPSSAPSVPRPSEPAQSLRGMQAHPLSVSGTPGSPTEACARPWRACWGRPRGSVLTWADGPAARHSRRCVCRSCSVSPRLGHTSRVSVSRPRCIP